MGKKIFALAFILAILATMIPSVALAGGPHDSHPNKGKNADKTSICHNGQDISVGGKAAAAHLNHGDALGPCSTD